MVRERPYLWWSAHVVALAALFVAAGFLGIYLPRQHRTYYLLFHTLVELFSLIIAAGIFMIAWASRRLHTETYFSFVGGAYLYAALFDLLHTLTYKGMGIFPEATTDLPTQFWIAARLVQTAGLVLAAGAIRSVVPMSRVLIGGAIAFGLLIASILWWRVFPTCFIEGQGLTRFKITAEYVLCSLLIASMILLVVRRRHFDRQVLAFTLASLTATICSELLFTLYAQPDGVANWLGHCLKVLAFYLLYRAIVVTGLTRPYDLLFRDLQQAKAEAEAANTAKDQFLAVLSHELRNPLAPILMAASSAERELGPDHPVAQDVGIIRRNAALQSRLIDDLLDLTRIARGKLEIAPREVDAHELLEHSVEVCRADVEGKDLRLTLQLDSREKQILADPARIQQVFWNLIKNAVKFTPAGGAIRVRSWNAPPTPGDGASALSARARWDMAIFIEVQDTGIGISRDFLPQVFNAFEQGSRAITRRFGGLGLGLAISKAIVELHGGTLTAASAGPGKGATFTLEMPVLSASRHKPSLPAAGGGIAPAEPAHPRPLRILLVEDHEDTARLMSRLLTVAQHRVHTAASIEAAMHVLSQQPVDLLISDVGLPDGSGHDLMRRIHSERGIPGICLSGYGMERDIRASRDAGFAEHLTKPVDFAELERAIQRVQAGERSEGNRVRE